MSLKSTYKAPDPLPAGWTVHRAPTGHLYYYNAETKQSTYQRPAAQSPSVQPAPIAPSPGLSNAQFTHSAANFRGLQSFNPNGYLNSHLQRGNFSGGHSYQDQRRRDGEDRPKHKYDIPGCKPWVLVKTKLGRRFVHNTETRQSLWKFPEDVMKGVVEFDRKERERRERRERGEPSDEEDEAALAVESLATGEEEDQGHSSDEYEEVEVTEYEDEDEENGPKRQRLDEDDKSKPHEFTEDDIAYQLAAMEADYGGDGYEDDVGWEDGEAGLSEEDTRALFRDLLDDHNINPFTPWESVVEAGHIIGDDRYSVYTNMKARKEAYNEWTRDRIQELKEQRAKEEEKDPRVPYMSFLNRHATPKLYWPEFKRKYRKEAEMRDPKISDKDREKWYREYINRLKLPQSTLKSDLTSLLKSVPLSSLNRSSTLVSLPPEILRDMRYISLPERTREPMIEIFITMLPLAPKSMDISPANAEEMAKKMTERERREKALAEREKRVQAEKRRQRRDMQYGLGRLREEEMELQRAMKVGKDGLKAHLEELEQPIGEGVSDSA